MVVSTKSLSYFDLLVWLRTGQEAARRLATSQPSVSRRVNEVADTFALQLSKSAGEWQVEGDATLLNLERQVHQRYRWDHGLPLRLEAQFYSGPLFCQGLGSDWIRGNFDFLEIHTPLRHLRDGVIDAWIATHPDLPDDDDPDFACFPLIRYPTRLVVAQDHPLLELGQAIRLEDVWQYPTLALADGAYPKVQAALMELNLWNQRLAESTRLSLSRGELPSLDPLAVSPATLFTIGLFEPPQVFLPVEIPMQSGDTLIVRRDHANHPRLEPLLAHLRQMAAQLAERHGDVELAFSEQAAG